MLLMPIAITAPLIFAYDIAAFRCSLLIDFAITLHYFAAAILPLAISDFHIATTIFELLFSPLITLSIAFSADARRRISFAHAELPPFRADARLSLRRRQPPLPSPPPLTPCRLCRRRAPCRQLSPYA